MRMLWRRTLQSLLRTDYPHVLHVPLFVEKSSQRINLITEMKKKSETKENSQIGQNNNSLNVKVTSLSRFRLFVTPWAVAYQAPPSMGFSRQEYYNGLSFPSPGIFPTQGSNPGLLHCRQMLYPLSHQHFILCLIQPYI